ncbi:MAG: phage tail protein [Cytophagales bacterium]|nr:phage tail protein [Cytophagales bacterium]
MKKTALFILPFLLIFSALSGQGIVVQGIARDGNHAAIGNQNLGFQFSIVDSNGSPIYVETQNILTDPYGVFSHVIGTGQQISSNGSFNSIDFGSSEMELIISVTYDGTTVQISNSPFRYVPYAHHARNGVPPGTLIAYVGATAPDGWMICDGSEVPMGTSLRDLMTHTPDLRGMFLRGTGTNATAMTAQGNSPAGPGLNAFQTDAYENHNHANTLSIDNGGNHSHSNSASTRGLYGNGIGSSGGVSHDGSIRNQDGHNGFDHPVSVTINNGGVHSHSISGGISVNGRADETRPVSYGVSYIIKL